MSNLTKLYHFCNDNLHFIYLIFAIPTVYFCITEIPPFQNPDEPNHFARAEQVSRLIIVPHFVYHKTDVGNAYTSSTNRNLFLSAKGGFDVDKSIYEISDIYSPLFFHYQVKADRAKADSVKNIHWGKGTAYRNFANTAIYPPFVYTMPALGITIGKAIGLSVVKTLCLSKMFNGIAALALSFLALSIAKRSKILLFSVLLFPLSTALFSSVSQDAILISCSFLLIAIVENVESTLNESYTNYQKCTMIILICIISISRPPYLLLSLVIPFLKLDRKTKIIGIVVPIVCVCIWLFNSSANFGIKFPGAEPDYNAQLQLQHILHHPLKFIGVFFNFDIPAIENVFRMFVGVLGWLDLVLPIDYYHTAYIILFIAFISTAKLKMHDSIELKIALFCAAFATLLAVLTAQYVTWTLLYAAYFNGMQGRYIIPLFPFLALSVCLSVEEDKITKLKQYALVPILLFPIFTSLVLIDGVINRYYFK